MCVIISDCCGGPAVGCTVKGGDEMMLRSLLRLLLFRRRTERFYNRCIRLGDGRARVLLPTPPWWREVSDRERPEFERRYDEFYRQYPWLIEFQPPRPQPEMSMSCHVYDVETVIKSENPSGLDRGSG